MANDSIAIGLIDNAALLLALGLVYDILTTRNARAVSRFLSGLVVGAIAVALMATPVHWAPGVIFDTRTILLSLTGLFFGTAPTLVAVAIAALYRLTLGGGGAAMGVATILLSGFCGLAWRRLRVKDDKIMSLGELYLFGLVVHLGMLLCIPLLPKGSASGTFRAVALPVLAIYPVCSALLGSLLAKERKRWLLEEELGQSALRYNQLAEQSRTIIWEVDADGLFTYVSSIVGPVLGHSDHDLVEKRYIFDLVPSFRHILDSETSFENVLTTVHTRDYGLLWMSSNVLPRKDAAGRLTGYRGSLTDVTERKLLQDRLLESEALHRTLFEQCPYGVVVIDPARAGIIDFNEQACRQLGYSREEFATLRISDIDVVEAPEQTEARVREIMEGGVHEFETVHRTRQGELRNVLVKAQYSPAQGKGIYHCIWQDVTQKKREEQLIRTRSRLVEFSLSHDAGELLTEALDQLEELTGSSIGFFHLLDEDGVNVALAAWSTRTGGGECAASWSGNHYDLKKGGVLVDCVLMRQPVIHNDYPSLPHRKGLPHGHIPLGRVLTVPILRGGKVLAVMAVGNKVSCYTQEDVEIVSRFAELVWEMVEKKQVHESLRESNERFSLAFEKAPIMITISDLEDCRYLDANRCFLDAAGHTKEEVIGRNPVEIGWIGEEELARLHRLVLEEGAIEDLELELQPRSGRKMHCRYWGTVITTGGKKRLLCTALDITEQRRIERQLHRARQAALP